MLNQIRRLLLLSALLFCVVGCEGLTIETIQGPVDDTAGSGDTGGSEADTGDDAAADTEADSGPDTVADTEEDTAPDTATDTEEDTAPDTAEDTAPDTAADTLDDTATDTGTVETNACGGVLPLIYRGVAAAPGDSCGGCGDGQLFCSGTSDLSCGGASEANACGGCGLLDGEVGASCGLCGDGRLACALGTTDCVGARPPNACGGCTTLALEPGTECALSGGVAGVVVCAGGEGSLCASLVTNACGGTTPLELPAGITGVEPRPGVSYDSGCRRGVLRCDGPLLVAVDVESGNACGGCDPLLGEPGASCDACGGVWVCDVATGVRCDGGGRNACGGCEPLAAEPGSGCDEGGISGAVICIGSDETSCVLVGATNGCGGVGSLTGDALGTDCGLCGDGVVVCNATDPSRRSTVCETVASIENACGGCGLLDDVAGGPCGTCGLGETACNAAKDGFDCIGNPGAAALNRCGGCGLLAGEPGAACGRCGSWACDTIVVGRLDCVEPAAGCASIAICGNGAAEAGESCDDGNTVTEECAYGEISCSVCNATCQTASGETDYCTDGALDAGEFCDDGNTINLDACNNSCTCGSGFHAQSGVCASDVQACAILYGTGTESWTGSAYGSCTLATCDSAYHAAGNACDANVISCPLSNATAASQTWNSVTSAYGTCTLTTCDSGYHANGNACDANVISCTLANATAASQTWNSGTTSYGSCTATACASTYHLESGACVSDTRSCAIADGTGTQTYASGSWGTCTLTSCDSRYHAAGNVCAANVISCTLANATTATQTWNSVTSAYGTCTATACASTYHIESGACVSDTRSCSSANATAATETWNSATSAYGTCTASACASGYWLNTGACVLQSTLGTACTINAACASGFCATGPVGTTNDRCAPAGMNYIPSGTFMMGSPSGEVGADSDETQHAVILSRSFFMAQTEVTQGQWKALSGRINPSWFQSTTGTEQTRDNANDSGPAENMDWYAAVAFANARSASEGLTSCYTLTGCDDAVSGWQDGFHTGCTGAILAGLTCTGYRLPTESEWENAARGGTTTATYLGDLSGSVTDCTTAQANLDGIAWWCKNSGSRTNAVGGKTANSFGLYDMLGNVREWTGDLYDTYPGSVTDPTGRTGFFRANRGGAWYNNANSARAADRYFDLMSFGDAGLGFRLSRTVTRGCTTALPLNATAGVEAGNAGGWGACEATACATSYHVESSACVLDTRSCSPLPSNTTAGTQTWDSSMGAYGTCTASACASGYSVVGGVCVASLGIACAFNDECASGNCATRPTGTTNDRCAPTSMNYLPAGTFTMGSPGVEVGRSSDETQHSVTLSRSFFMGQTEVTQGQWKALSGGTNPSCFQSTTGTACTTSNANDSGPAEYLDWYAAVAFANARSAAEGLTSCYTLTGCTDAVSGWKDGIHSGCTAAILTGLTCTGYRLPTESEWEYAARGGTTTATYLGDLSGNVTACGSGASQANLDSIAWWCINAGGRTQSVSGKTANSFALYDMLGNVYEWTGDWYGTYPGTVTDPLGAGTGSGRVLRGGAWGETARYVRAALHSYVFSPVSRSTYTGFRLSRTVTRGCTTALPLNATAGVEAGNATGWGACEATACATSYHVESSACVLDTRSCSPLPSNTTAGTQTWDSSTGAYGTCTASACASGYGVVGGVCVASLGIACTINAECGSGFCATGPTGTTNDRCAPPGMNYIPAGTFSMGSPSTEVGRDTDETQHSVTRSRSFFMGQTEVTQGQWKALSGMINPSYFQSTTGTVQTTSNANDSGPVEYLDWYAAVAFANAKSAAEGLTACYTLTGCTDAANGWKDGIHTGCTGATFAGLTCTGYRLPTESEWEYAARGGTTAATYLGNLSGTVTDCTTAQANLDGIAWWCKNAGSRTQAVGGKTANSFGLYDMLGNVFEWTGDWYNATYPGTVTDPLGAGTGSYRVVRGGSWIDGARYARAASRYVGTPGDRGNSLGFRLSRTAP